MKNIVFVRGGDIIKNTYPVQKKNMPAYEQLFTMGKDRGFKMVWTSLNYFDEQKGVFKAYTWFDGKQWRKVQRSIKPDFIYEKSIFRYKRIKIKHAMAAVAPLLNPVELQIIASDKMLTYLTFPDEVYPSVSVHSQDDIKRGLEIIKTKKIVMKPLNGSGGSGVEFLSRNQAKKFKPEGAYIMQEFIDASHGIPKIYDGIHDFRLLFLGNKLFHAFYRTNAPGTLMCNVTQGAIRVVVPLAKVPKKMKEISKVIQKRFKNYANSFYSVDFVFGPNGKPKIIEINSTSGLDNSPGYDKHLKFVYKRILDHIEKFV